MGQQHLGAMVRRAVQLHEQVSDAIERILKSDFYLAAGQLKPRLHDVPELSVSVKLLPSKSGKHGGGRKEQTPAHPRRHAEGKGSVSVDATRLADASADDAAAGTVAKSDERAASDKVARAGAEAAPARGGEAELWCAGGGMAGEMGECEQLGYQHAYEKQVEVARKGGQAEKGVPGERTVEARVLMSIRDALEMLDWHLEQLMEMEINERRQATAAAAAAAEREKAGLREEARGGEGLGGGGGGGSGGAGGGGAEQTPTSRSPAAAAVAGSAEGAGNVAEQKRVVREVQLVTRVLWSQAKCHCGREWKVVDEVLHFAAEVACTPFNPYPPSPPGPTYLPLISPAAVPSAISRVSACQHLKQQHPSALPHAHAHGSAQHHRPRSPVRAKAPLLPAPPPPSRQSSLAFSIAPIPRSCASDGVVARGDAEAAEWQSGGGGEGGVGLRRGSADERGEHAAEEERRGGGEQRRAERQAQGGMRVFVPRVLPWQQHNQQQQQQPYGQHQPYHYQQQLQLQQQQALMAPVPRRKVSPLKSRSPNHTNTHTHTYLKSPSRSGTGNRSGAGKGWNSGNRGKEGKGKEGKKGEGGGQGGGGQEGGEWEGQGKQEGERVVIETSPTERGSAVSSGLDSLCSAIAHSCNPFNPLHVLGPLARSPLGVVLRAVGWPVKTINSSRNHMDEHKHAQAYDQFYPPYTSGLPDSPYMQRMAEGGDARKKAWEAEGWVGQRGEAAREGYGGSRMDTGGSYSSSTTGLRGGSSTFGSSSGGRISWGSSDVTVTQTHVHVDGRGYARGSVQDEQRGEGALDVARGWLHKVGKVDS
ncbi:hypothetical protein CLOP_g24406 [Closterium sp. NIES-67]|nr:hypothetical protein CLOP_g24406 [Closterium sp. NIES-67]